MIQMNFYFILFTNRKLFLLECKSHKGNTFPLSCLTQFGKLQQYKDIDGLNAGVILWFTDHNKVLYVPIQTIIYLADDGKKSVNIKDIDSEKYVMYDLPSEIKRTFLTTDYSRLMEV